MFKNASTTLIFAIALITISPCFSADLADSSADIPTLTADRASFFENFDESVKSSGTPLVGLRLVDVKRYKADESVKLDNVQVAVPGVSDGAPFCARAVTQDGRFLAANTYRLGSPSADGSKAASKLNVARLDPLTVKYASELGAYAVDNFALRVFLPLENCKVPAEAVHLPEVPVSYLDSSGRDYQLQVRVNGGPKRVSAYLYPIKTKNVRDNPSEKHLATGVCEHSRNDPGLAFNNLCGIDIGKISGLVWIRIELNDGRRDKGYAYKAYIPHR